MSVSNNERPLVTARTLPRLAAEGLMPHAVLVEGGDGMELARRICMALLCEHGGCGECGACKRVLSGGHSDLIITDCADRDSVKVNAVRGLCAQLWRAPNEGRCKVWIFKSADNLPENTQNLLLRVIEEPPPDTAFLLLCDNKYRLLGTIRSRVCAVRLSAEDDGLPDGASEALELTRGDVALARELAIDKALRARCEAARAVSDAAASHSRYGIMSALAPFEKDRAAYRQVVGLIAAMASPASPRDMTAWRRTATIRLAADSVIGMIERNGYLPLVSALLAGRATQ